MALAQVAQATQPACIHELGEVHQLHRPLLPVDQDITSTALSPFRRQNPRDEPGALAAHAGMAGRRSTLATRSVVSRGRDAYDAGCLAHHGDGNCDGAASAGQPPRLSQAIPGYSRLKVTPLAGTKVIAAREQKVQPRPTPTVKH